MPELKLVGLGEVSVSLGAWSCLCRVLGQTQSEEYMLWTYALQVAGALCLT